MRGFILGLSVSVAFIAGVVSSSLIVSRAEAAGGKATLALPGKPPVARDDELPALVMPIPRWEYICYRAELSHKLVEVANQAGEEGWEMVGTDGQGSQPSVWCFKRRKNAPIER